MRQLFGLFVFTTEMHGRANILYSSRISKGRPTRPFIFFKYRALKNQVQNSKVSEGLKKKKKIEFYFSFDFNLQILFWRKFQKLSSFRFLKKVEIIGDDENRRGRF